MTSIPEMLSIMKEKQMVEEKDFPFARKILMDCEKGLEEEKRSIDEKYSKIIEEDYKQYKRTNDLLFDRIEKLKKAKSDKEARYEEKIIEFRGRISRLKETKRKMMKIWRRKQAFKLLVQLALTTWNLLKAKIARLCFLTIQNRFAPQLEIAVVNQDRKV
ncbi:hypothetical protein P3S68_012288 [Capsicum galapagoense]